MNEELKKMIGEARNICVIPSEHEPESFAAALALFYTLRELGKNANLIIDTFPEKLQFLVPSLDFITTPKNFVIAIPRSVANISQIYYEKNDDNLKIHLTIDKGRIKKEQVAFYYADAKPDLVVTLGIQDLQSSLSQQLDSFGFILDAPIINIDNRPENKKFGSINLLGQTSLSEIVFDAVKSINEQLIKGPAANCLLAGLVIHYDNFKSVKIVSGVFQLCSELVQRGAHYHQMVEHLHRASPEEVNFLGEILQQLNIKEGLVPHALLSSDNFQDFGEADAKFAVEKIKAIGIQHDLLVLWKSHASGPATRGFFYSKHPNLIQKVAQMHQALPKDGWVFLVLPETDIHLAKEQVSNLLS